MLLSLIVVDVVVVVVVVDDDDDELEANVKWLLCNYIAQVIDLDAPITQRVVTLLVYLLASRCTLTQPRGLLLNT